MLADFYLIESWVLYPSASKGGISSEAREPGWQMNTYETSASGPASLAAGSSYSKALSPLFSSPYMSSGSWVLWSKLVGTKFLFS
jgi:hypothetical protein